jgi:hypothetical protein
MMTAETSSKSGASPMSATTEPKCPVSSGKRPEDFSLADPAVQSSPYEFYHTLHEKCPVYKVPETGIYLISSFRELKDALDNYGTMRGQPYNVGLSEANLTKRQLCERIQRHVPGFVWLEAPIGEDPDKRDYIVSNQRILSTGYTTEWNLERGIQELIKGYTIMRNSVYSNV